MKKRSPVASESSSDIEADLPYQAASRADSPTLSPPSSSSSSSSHRRSSSSVDASLSGPSIIYYDSNPLLRLLRTNRRTFLLFAFAALVGVLLAACVFFAVVTFTDDGSGGNNNNNNNNNGGHVGWIDVPTAAVSTENKVCSDIGLSMIKDLNGNAVDAAVASCLCIGVLNSFSSGIGGGGVMLIRMSDGREVHLDFREVAPAAATQDMYVADPSKSVLGPISNAVPGELAGLEHAWRNYGSGNVTWKQIVKPSADLAAGYTVHPLLAVRIQSALNGILADPGLKSVYAPDGVAKKEGDRVSNPRLSETLNTVAENGARAFYDPASQLAQNLIRDVQAGGGIITSEDLSNYYNHSVKERTPIGTFYQGYEVLGAGAPFGGLCMMLALNILERYNLPMEGPGVTSYHWLAEALAFAFSDRMALGDPEFVDLSKVVPAMLSKEHAGDLRRRLLVNATFPYTHYEDLAPLTNPTKDSGTTHISVVDGQRNAVALTSTVNLVFGSKFMSTSTGVIMNNEMDDFSTPNRSNSFNLPPSAANFIAPGKRPLSSMSPTIVVRDGSVFLVAGASGGSRIITATLQVLLNVIAFKRDAWQAVSLPRVHYQLLPTPLYHETAFPSDIIDGLQRIGHQTDVMAEVGVTQAILVKEDNILHAASDPRKLGVPAGY